MVKSMRDERICRQARVAPAHRLGKVAGEMLLRES